MTVSEAVAAAAKRASEQLTFLKSVADKKAAEKREQEASNSMPPPRHPQAVSR